MARGQRIETRTEESRDDYCTPPEALTPVLAFGEIILDPCSNADSIVPARRALFETSKPHGLDADWGEIVREELARRPAMGLPIIYVNFPYVDTARWVEKIVHHWRADRIATIALSPARTETELFHDVIFPSVSAICFRRRRINFLIDGVPMKQPRHASMYSAWFPEGKEIQFREAFEKHGAVMEAMPPF